MIIYVVTSVIDRRLSVRAQVTHLVIKRPQFFHFKPGDYVYINIPEIAKYEWHPFTISSAPEQPGTCRRRARRQSGVTRIKTPVDPLRFLLRTFSG